MKRFNKQFWKKGSGELFSFICVSPIIVFIIMALVGILQVSSFKEQFEYASYCAARAAVVSDDMKTAKTNANKVFEENLLQYAHIYKKGSLQMKLEYAKGLPSYTKKKDKNGLFTSRKGAIVTNKWEKGGILKCTAKVRLNTVMGVLLPGEKTYTLYMLIEKPG